MAMPRKISCTVKAITPHGGRVYTLDLETSSPVPVFRPGQFLHLTVDEYDPAGFWPESRVFSIASSPINRSELRICYAVKGHYTTRMEERLAVGSTVWVKLPYGEFVIDGTQETVLMAGGTGISAFTAFLEALKPEQAAPVWLVYGARNPSLLLFQDMLLRQLKSVPNFRLLFFTESAEPGFEKQFAGLAKPPECLSGRISLDVLWPKLAAPANKVFYLSGPPIMLKTLSQQLVARGLPAERVRTDAWE